MTTENGDNLLIACKISLPHLFETLAHSGALLLAQSIYAEGFGLDVENGLYQLRLCLVRPGFSPFRSVSSVLVAVMLASIPKKRAGSR